MKYQVRTSLPLANTQFNGDDDKKKRRKTKKAKRKEIATEAIGGKGNNASSNDSFSRKNAKSQGFTKMSPKQIKNAKVNILKLEETDPAKGKAARAKLMSELKKGYYKT
tara:strand:- start:3745 stop:4071 length:327 start_codon:yes stop_codon:yes gene_type:complete